MAGRFLLRDKDTTENPIAPRLYDLGITVGRNVFYLPNASGNRTAFIALLSEGARFYGDTGIKGALKVLFAGFEIPEFDASGARNWRVAKGTVPAPPVYKSASFRASDEKVLSAGHGLANGDPVAFHWRKTAGVPATLPAAITERHKKYFVINATADDYQISTVAAGAPIAFDVDSAGAVFAYKANAGLFDADQGTPFFFPNLKYAFAGLSYIEILLPADLSNGEDEPTKLKVMLDGKLVFDFEEDGEGLLVPTGAPISAKSPALISYDVLKNDARLPVERFNAPSWIEWRDRAAEKISWIGGNEVPAHPQSFDVLSNMLYNAETGVLQSTGVPARAFSPAFTARNASAEVVFQGGGTGDVELIFTAAQDASPVNQRHGLIVTPNGTLYFTNGTQVYVIGSAAPSDRLKLAYEDGIFKAYKNAVPLSLAHTIVPAQPAGNFYIYLGLKATGRTLTDIRLQPSGTVAAPRLVDRYTGGCVILAKTAAVDIFENEVALSAGVSWQDVDGEIVMLSKPDRPVVAVFNADPASSFPTNCKRITIKRRDQKAAPTDYRFSFRDRDDPVLTRKYVFVAREERRDDVGYIDSGLLEFGVITQSQMERIGETIATLRTDLDTGWTVEAFLDTLEAAKGDFVHVIDPASGFTEDAPALAMVLTETLLHNAPVETRTFDLTIVVPDFYSDTRHGRAVLTTHNHISAYFIPPPALANLTLSETARYIENATISVLEGIALFNAQAGQRARVFHRALGAPVSFVFNFPPSQLEGASLAALEDQLVLAVAEVGGTLPAGISDETAYRLKTSTVDPEKYQLFDADTDEVISATDAGAGSWFLFPAVAWRDTGLDVLPDATTQTGVFALDAVSVGFHQVRLQTFSAGGATLGFLAQLKKTFEVLGDVAAPDAPDDLQPFFDGVTLRWRWNPSASPNVAGYQITDDNGRVIKSFINGLEFVETSTASIVRRRVYAVSRSGVRSVDFAAAVFILPSLLVWLGIVGGSVRADGALIKVAADAWGNCGARLNQTLMTNAVEGELSYIADTTNQFKAFGFSRLSAIDSFADFDAGVYLLDDGTVHALYKDGAEVFHNVFAGAYQLGDELILRFGQNFELGGTDPIRILRARFEGATRVVEELFEFPAIPVRFPAFAGVALYSLNSVFEPTLKLSGELIADEGTVPPAPYSANVLYDDATGSLEADGADGFAVFDGFAQDEDGLFQFSLSAGSEFSVFLDPFPFETPDTPSFFSVDFLPDSSIIIRNDAGATFAVGNYLPASVITIGKENQVATVRVDGVLIFRLAPFLTIGGEHFLVFPTAGEMTNLRFRKAYNVATDGDGQKLPITVNLEQARVGENVNYEIPKFLDAREAVEGDTVVFQSGAFVPTAFPSGLPDQSTNAGKFLTTDGSVASWTTLPSDLPSQAGQAGKFLTTNGAAVSWATVSGMSVGNAVGAATNNQLLYVSGGNLAQSANLTFDGAKLSVGVYITSPHTGTDSERFGFEAEASGYQSNAFGKYATASGYQSNAFGYNARGLHSHCIAIGKGSTAQDAVVEGWAIAIGNNTASNGWYSIAVGSQAYANGHFSGAYGGQANATAYASFAMGFGSQATASSAVAFGVQSTASNDFAFAMGHQAAVSGAYGIGIGKNATISASNGIAVGQETTVSHSNSIALGKFAASTASSQLVIGGQGAPITEVRQVYDATTRFVRSLSSGGLVTFEAAGTSPKFRFDKPVERKAGASVAYAQVGGVLFDYYTTVLSGTTLADFYSDSVPADLLNENGAKLRAVYFGTCAKTSDLKHLSVEFGGVEVASFPDMTAYSFRIEVEIVRRSASSFVAVARIEGESLALPDPTFTISNFGLFSFATDQALKLRGFSEVAEEIEVLGGKIFYYPAEA